MSNPNLGYHDEAALRAATDNAQYVVIETYAGHTVFEVPHAIVGEVIIFDNCHIHFSAIKRCGIVGRKFSGLNPERCE